LLWRKPERQKKEVFFIGADPKIRNFAGTLRRLRFGPDVFADALAPKPARIVAARDPDPQKPQDACLADVGSDPGGRCVNGYRFAKRQGKLN